ncbi:hypothetical protein Baya_1602 [Bagarius yarrelli]|uniref:Uncharacterized protein n=1 Tax=Bagarius yarrelli TaxID=175774 RepID=A0A556TLK8_BAGYA|nr:hypothetical protein Baya_1602 [Bagarius yarrelli]
MMSQCRDEGLSESGDEISVYHARCQSEKKQLANYPLAASAATSHELPSLGFTAAELSKQSCEYWLSEQHYMNHCPRKAKPQVPFHSHLTVLKCQICGLLFFLVSDITSPVTFRFPIRAIEHML